MKQPFVHYWRKKSDEREGRYPQRIQKVDVDQENAHQRLHSVGLKAESEGFITKPKPQHQELRNHNNKNGVDPKYRICDQYDETVDHLVPGCSTILLLNIITDMTESVNTFIGRSINITKPHTITTVMNINQSLLLKHRASQSLGFHNTYR